MDLVEAKQNQEVLAKAGYKQVTTFLHPLQVKAAERCYQILHDAGFVTLTDANTSGRMVEAIHSFVSNYKPPSQAPTVAELAATSERSRAHRDKRTRDDYKSTLKPFIAAFGDRGINEITSAELSAYIADRPVSNTTKSRLWAVLHVFFNLACKNTEYGPQWLTENPVKEATRINADFGDRVIYQLVEVKALIQAAIYLGCAPIAIFRLLTMMRADEAKRFLDVTRQRSPSALQIKQKETSTGKQPPAGFKVTEPWDYRSAIVWDTEVILYSDPTDKKNAVQFPCYRFCNRG